MFYKRCATGVESSWHDLKYQFSRTGESCRPDAIYYRTISFQGPYLFAVVDNNYVFYHDAGKWTQYESANSITLHPEPMNCTNNKINICNTISNPSLQEEISTNQPRLSSVRNRKRKMIWFLITFITSVILILGIGIPAILLTKKKVDSSTTILSPLTTTTTTMSSATKIKATRTSKLRTTTLRTTRTPGSREKPPDTARPSKPNTCTIS
ncbi:hypothetical protein I4U23_005167 [Adineta vaga]|nr:hypothetical protein I4U23_005167 [Adineta vaga]